jgi:hypothetical protein
MPAHRTIAGLPVIAESPSSFRIVTPGMDAAGLKSWIKYVGRDASVPGWTITWEEHGRPVISNLRWTSAYEVALYLIRLGQGSAA